MYAILKFATGVGKVEISFPKARSILRQDQASIYSQCWPSKTLLGGPKDGEYRHRAIDLEMASKTPFLLEQSHVVERKIGSVD